MHVGSKFSMPSKTSIVTLMLLEFPPSATFPCLFELRSAHLCREMTGSAEDRNTDQTVTSVYIYITFFQPPWYFLLLSENTQKSPQTQNHQKITCSLSTRNFCIIIPSFPPPISQSLQRLALYIAWFSECFSSISSITTFLKRCWPVCV